MNGKDRFPLHVVPAMLAAALLLGACALGSGDTRYRLIEPQVQPPARDAEARSQRLIAIARPVADQARDSSNILVRRGRSLLPWAGAAWIDRSPDLVQDLLVTYLDGSVATVGRHGSLPNSYRLDLVLRRFEFAEDGDGLAAEVAVTARLFDPRREFVTVTRLDVAEAVASSGSLEAAVAAMETALETVFSDLAGWLETHFSESAARDG